MAGISTRLRAQGLTAISIDSLEEIERSLDVVIDSDLQHEKRMMQVLGELRRAHMAILRAHGMHNELAQWRARFAGFADWYTTPDSQQDIH